MSRADWLSPSSWDLAALRQRWQEARPFPHLVFDGLLPAEREAELLAAFDDEPCELLRDEIFEFMASPKRPTSAGLRAFQEGLQRPAVLEALQAITGKALRRVEIRGYAYHPGHYLLPHSDHQAEIGRALAFAYYLRTPWRVVGGELELFSCAYEGREIVATRPEVKIAPLPNRLSLFDVGDDSLHQVCEVTEGIRLSVSGWFYP